MKRRSITCAEDLYSFSAVHPAETMANLDKIPIRENREAMVDLRDACPNILVRPLNSRMRTLKARASVAQRLNEAQDSLQQHAPGYQIVVVDAWRPNKQQTRWHKLAKAVVRLRHPFWPCELVREAANQYVAAPDASAPPPHSTGGAVDLRLRGPDKKDLCMGPRTLAACRTEYAGLSSEQRHNRHLLSYALERAGFSNYEEEWWHWSYEDSGWALRTNYAYALYDRWKEIDGV
jgi:D-alanyl-D-alanine dipeptidase